MIQDTQLKLNFRQTTNALLIPHVPVCYIYQPFVAQLVKNLPAMRETWDRSLGWEDTLEKGKATHFSVLVWRIPWTV